MKLFKNADKRLVSSGLLISAGAVLIYCLAGNFSAVLAWFNGVLGYFSSVTGGLILAYVMRPLANFVERLLPKGMKEKTRTHIGAICALIVLLIILLVVIFTVLPSLISSASSFVNNIDSYVDSAKQLIGRFAGKFDGLDIDVDKLVGSSDELLRTAAKWAGDNITTLANAVYQLSSQLINFIIIMAMATYALFDRKNLKKGCKRVGRMIFGEELALKIEAILSRGDGLMRSFLGSNLMDALIVGFVNFIFLGIVECPYQLLLALMLGITNYIPTFGPIIGGVIGGVIVLLTKPSLLLGFIIFTVVLQQIDGNVIKPLLFGDRTGLSPFWVLVAIVAGGKMFGVLGMVLGVPVVALLASLLSELLEQYDPTDASQIPQKKEPLIKRLFDMKFGSSKEETPGDGNSASPEGRPQGKKAGKKAKNRV